MNIKHELQNIISGDGSVRYGENIKTIRNHLRRQKEAISRSQEKEFDKEQETKILIEYIDKTKFWMSEVDASKYIGEGAEQKVYEYPDPRYVMKLNDSIFYRSWNDYFNSLLIHNFFFENVAYNLIGFTRLETLLHAVVIQPYIKTSENTNLDNVVKLLEANGFINRKNNDYYHPELGIIIEDLHDENVLTSEGVLQFIDTVIYLADEFYAD